ncbi:hypothetical protein [Numidum massiliense]|uniref:hypothetical protein n=1 Tax=Numidum massiliense TaxID=1522315 RepID=UPI0006D581C8|nr:hypothetical protein [Numidum massiliense]
MKVDLNAPIEPWKGLGGISLYTHISEFYGPLQDFNVEADIVWKFLISYEVDNEAIIWFNVINGKIYKLTALENYKGLLFNQIHVGMHIDDVLKIEHSFEYDEFEEVYESPKGVYIETDPITHRVICISVFVKEIDDEDFEEGKW